MRRAARHEASGAGSGLLLAGANLGVGSGQPLAGADLAVLGRALGAGALGAGALGAGALGLSGSLSAGGLARLRLSARPRNASALRPLAQDHACSHLQLHASAAYSTAREAWLYLDHDSEMLL